MVPEATTAGLAAEWVVPGHGSPGGHTLIERALALLEEQRRADEKADDKGN
jgi:hypothetical protein